ncbi:hypothetical protein [Argonema galeatum]|uniref:hypothetical protein n=1 Tax=Argonema galeatum TaxID=2942762 RepID=UPI0020135BD1|nr:hypothetical protein [Argonema galeatum]MCL1463880.1 hypothetical protein [Argonema galeatum A003/A1]
MNDQPYMPSKEVDKRLLDNLRRARLEMEEVGLQLEEVIAKLDDDIRKKRLRRVRRSLNRID